MTPERATLVVATPVGRLTLVAGDAGLSHVLWPRDAPPARATERQHPVLAEAERQLQEYFAGARTAFELPLDVGGTAFQRSAWLALQSIPFAATRTYGAQARRLGCAAGARAVGAANARNPVPIVLPCHRLVGADGALTGFAGGLDVKRALLEHEARVHAGAGAAWAGSARTRRSPAPRPRT
ncbi:MAG: methylated-DNA-[protein]-cysteine S-methyltransferase [Solirubrobacteraceae bacterium]|nr:methylated-DNA-[protein]-cysteine S-methyltransferase [Solirubrobacteraceae bacterium]